MSFQIPRALVAGLILLTVLPAPAAASHFPPGAPVHLLGGLSEKSLDPDQDGSADELLLDVPLRIRSAGTYEVTAVLGWSGGSVPLATTVTLPVGDRGVVFRVPGGFIANRDLSTPYTLEASVRKAGNATVIDRSTYAMSAHPSESFAPAEARLALPPVLFPVDEDADGRPDVLTVDVPVLAKAAGRYRVTLDVRDEGNRALAAVPPIVADLAPGGSVLSAEVPRASLTLTYAGSYRVDATLHHLPASGAARLLDVATAASDRYRMAAFGSASEARLGAAAITLPGGTASVPVAGLGLEAAILKGGYFEVSARILDPATREWAEAKSGAKRQPEEGGAATLLFPAKDATRVLRGSDSPVAHYFLRDHANGLIVGGGRLELRPSPEVTLAYLPTDVLPDEPVTLEANVTTGAPGDVVSWLWDLGDGFRPGSSSTTTSFPTARPHRVVVRAVNVYGISTETNATVDVRYNAEPVLGALVDWVAEVGKPSSYVVSATDPEGRPLRILSKIAPIDVQVDGLVVSWDSPRLGDHRFGFALSDGRHEIPFGLLVRVRPPSLDVVEPPILVRRAGGGPLEAAYTVAPGASFTLALEAVAVNGSATLAIDPLPGGATFDGATLSWAAPSAGTHRFTVKATAGNDTASTGFDLIVLGAVPPPEGLPGPDGETAGGTGDEREGIPGPGVALALAALGAAGILRARRR